MTTAAKRARKKANKLKGWPPEDINDAVQEQADVAESEMMAVTTESEHAAVMMALAKARKMRKKAGE